MVKAATTRGRNEGKRIRKDLERAHLKCTEAGVALGAVEAARAAVGPLLAEMQQKTVPKADQRTHDKATDRLAEACSGLDIAIKNIMMRTAAATLTTAGDALGRGGRQSGLAGD